MLRVKEGFPGEEELLLCTVQSIQFHSVFVTLDEYANKRGMIHISEIAPGRIRNIRDYVKEGKKVVCKVLGVNPEKGHIDISLRRVNEMQRRQKLEDVKQEQLAEKIIEHLAKRLGKELVKLYNEVSEKVLKKHTSLYSCFEEVAHNNLKLETLGIEQSVAKTLEDDIKLRIKPQEVRITGDLKMSSHLPDGIEVVKAVLKKAEKAGVGIRYKGAGTYLVEVVSDDFKKAEKILKSAIDTVAAEMKSVKSSSFEFARHEA